MKNHKISVLNIAFLYVGTLMGAGFASGREIWQFFGVFGENSDLAVLAVTILFVIFGMMTVKISKALDTTDIGKIIMPFENSYLENFFGYVTAAILFIVYIVMAAAGGALFQEQFGLHKAIGGLLLMLLVIATTLGGFERISKNFKFIIPVLLATVFLVCLNIIFGELPISGISVERHISPMTPNWYSSAMIYISYNMLAGIPILANSTHRAKTYHTALLGAMIGGLILGLAAFIMNAAMLTDEGLSSISVLPILALSGKLSTWVGLIYAGLLLFAVYASATSNFYGFTTKIREGRNKPYLIILSAVIGYAFSLFGFSHIIAFVLPLEGYCGVVFLIFMTIHFICIMTGRKPIKLKEEKDKEMIAVNKNNEIDKKEKKESDMNIKDRFQFAGGIKRVTAGDGGEALLIIGSEKTAVMDCGMAYCSDGLVENIKKELLDRPLNYVIMTHTHYDHIGGLPYLRKAWPELISFGAEHGKKVLEKRSALKQIEELSRVAWKQYKPSEQEPTVLMDGLKIDEVIRENDIISLGDKEILAIETPGHTSCSLTFVMEPEQIIFPSETTGVYTDQGTIISGVLKSYRETMVSLEKCRKINAKYIIAPHFGQVPKEDVPFYWDKSEASAKMSKDLILKKKKEGALFQEILEEYTKEFWKGTVEKQQPKEAFLLNAQIRISTVLKEFDEE